MVVLIRGNGIKTDPRVEKYLQYFIHNAVPYKVIGWDRLGENLTAENTIYYLRISGYNIGGYKAAANRLFWFLFVIKQLLKMKKQIRTLHGCDLDGVFPAIVYKLLTLKKDKVIFDVFDWFSDTLSNQSTLIRWVFRVMEKTSIKYADEVIICEEERIDQIPYPLKKEVKVLQNIPSFETIDFLYGEKKYRFDNTKKTISYVGGFYKERFIEELIQIAEEGYINLNIAGYGDQEIENRCLSLSNHPNINYYGKVNYKEGLNIMYNSDLIFAFYSVKNKNHIYAAPNKYYEAMLLGKPIITNSGTILSTKISTHQTGIIIEESIDDLKSSIKTLRDNEIDRLSFNARSLWVNCYKNKVSDFLQTEYSEIIL